MHERQSMEMVSQFIYQHHLHEKIHTYEAMLFHHFGNIVIFSHIEEEPYFVAKFFHAPQVTEVTLNDETLPILSCPDVYVSYASFFDNVTKCLKNGRYDEDGILIFTHPSKKTKLIVYMESLLSDPPLLHFRRLGGQYQYYLDKE